ncbi:MAG: insulinase family protein, partial [Firmicutes bacterium]|nr:insulinase family protein [Bacillota bacterium]
DPNLAFSISYKTPNTDESDRNHVFEHAILASSKKYPSDDVFFDVRNRTFNSYANAHTTLNNTAYEFASMSEAQFEKMIDVYLSCMVEPDILTDENYFKREALNYTLESKDADIEMGGTVYSEDMGFLNNIMFVAENAMIDTLYPDETVSNMIGRAELNYKDLTYKHTIELYDMCYHFDNSLIVLYGNMDYNRILKYIDDEYLSKYPDSHTDLSAFAPVPSQKSHNDTTVYMPAVEGDSVNGASAVYYAFDLYGLPEKDVLKYFFIAQMFGSDNSSIRKKLDDAGINSSYCCAIDPESEKPYLYFALMDTDENKKDVFKQIVESGIEEAAQNGFGDIYDTYFDQLALSSAVSGGGAETGVDIAMIAEDFWATFGDPDALSVYSDAKRELKNDGEQTDAKRLTAKLLDCENTAVIAIVPRPGDAEKVLEETEAYLSEMKASMTDAQLDELIAETKAYNEWLENGSTNDNVSVSPEELPGYESLPEVKTSTSGGIKTYSADIGKNIGMYEICFDASKITQKELYWTELYNMLIGKLGTDKYKKDEVTQKTDKLLFDFATDTAYNKNVDESTPSLKYSVSWYEYPQKYREGLEFALDMLQNSDFADTKTVINTIENNLPDYDAARADSPLKLAQSKALTVFGDEYAFKDYVSDEGFYNFLCEQLDKLKNEKGYSDTFAKKLGDISKKIIRRDNISAVIIGSKSVIDSTKKVNKDVLGVLPVSKGGGNTYDFEKPQKTCAYIGEFSNQYTASFAAVDKSFLGEYIPFVNYINDVYTVPEMRFKNGAYSCATTFSISSSTKRPYLHTYTYSDPNVGLTLESINAVKDVLPNAEITQEQLDNYITAAYSSLYIPSSDYDKAQKAVLYKKTGTDGNIEKNLIDGIKNAKISDKAAAAEAIKTAIENSVTATVGNANAINAEKDVFDKVTDMRKN